MKGDTDNKTIIVGNYNLSFLTTDRLSRWKIDKDIMDLNCTLDKMDLKIYSEHSIQQQHIHTLLNNT